MKKLSLLAGTCVLAFSVHAQNTYPWPSSGNIGIGTNSPSELLDVNGNIKWAGFNAGNPRGAKIGYSGSNYGGIGYNIEYTASTGIFNRPSADKSSYMEFWNGGFRFYGTDNYSSASGINLNGGGTNLNLLGTFTSTGRLGIGTAAPSQKLEVQGNMLSSVNSNEGGALILQNQLKTASNSAYNWILYNMGGPYGNSLQFWNYSQDGSMYGSRMTLADNGNVGIGTSSPAQKLDVAGAIQTRGDAGLVLANSQNALVSSYGTVYAYISRSSGSGTGYPWNANGSIVMQAGSYGGQAGFAFITGDSPSTKMAIINNGNVGIGTTTPAEKLSVNGTIRSKEVKVETANWPDYVFEEGYKVEKLEVLEGFIKANKHLPGIPSAKEVEKEGVSLGEMNARLLQKIEEMTLQMIEMNKRIKELESGMRRK